MGASTKHETGSITLGRCRIAAQKSPDAPKMRSFYRGEKSERKKATGREEPNLRGCARGGRRRRGGGARQRRRRPRPASGGAARASRGGGSGRRAWRRRGEAGASPGAPGGGGRGNRRSRRRTAACTAPLEAPAAEVAGDGHQHHERRGGGTGSKGRGFLVIPTGIGWRGLVNCT